MKQRTLFESFGIQPTSLSGDGGQSLPSPQRPEEMKLVSPKALKRQNGPLKRKRGLHYLLPLPFSPCSSWSNSYGFD